MLNQAVRPVMEKTIASAGSTLLLTRRRTFAALTLLAGCLAAVGAEITLPAETWTLRESSLPGYVIARQKCGICHSTDYISYQPPGMTLAQWTAEMQKMRRTYGAPISEDEVEQLGAYLAVTYGAAQASDAEVVDLLKRAATASTGTSADVSSNSSSSSSSNSSSNSSRHARKRQAVEQSPL